MTRQDLSVRVVKLTRKGPNWNPSYLTDNTWRTRCQQLLFFFFFFVKLEKYFCQGKPGATVKHLRRPSTSNVSKQAPSLKKKKQHKNTTHCFKYCIDDSISIYRRISPAIPVISGTERCLKTPNGRFILWKKVPKI